MNPFRRRRRSFFLLGAVSLAWGLFFLSPSCGTEKAAAPAAEKGADEARTETERGPVKVIVAVRPREPRLSDNPTFTLTVEAEEGVAVTLPPFGDSLGDFLIRNFRKPLPETRAGRRVIREIYELEPVRTGEHLIHPITIRFTDNRPQGDKKEHAVETEGLTVTVKSVLGDKIPSLADLDPAGGPKELPPEPFDALWLLVLVPAVVGAAAFLWWRKRRRRREASAPALSPRELAYLELEELIDAGYLERGEFALYYAALTSVVRRYIERTTGIRAPEQTTEEFLREVGRREAFPPRERLRLKSFLEAADLVKFAAMRPGREEIEASFERAKAFIGLDARAAGGATGAAAPGREGEGREDAPAGGGASRPDRGDSAGPRPDAAGDPVEVSLKGGRGDLPGGIGSPGREDAP